MNSLIDYGFAIKTNEIELMRTFSLFSLKTKQIGNPRFDITISLKVVATSKMSFKTLTMMMIQGQIERKNGKLTLLDVDSYRIFEVLVQLGLSQGLKKEVNECSITNAIISESTLIILQQTTISVHEQQPVFFKSFLARNLLLQILNCCVFSHLYVEKPACDYFDCKPHFSCYHPP